MAAGVRSVDRNVLLLKVYFATVLCKRRKRNKPYAANSRPPHQTDNSSTARSHHVYRRIEKQTSFQFFTANVASDAQNHVEDVKVNVR